jgi:hypothetical protein
VTTSGSRVFYGWWVTAGILVGAALLSLRIDDGRRRVRWAARAARA